MIPVSCCSLLRKVQKMGGSTALCVASFLTRTVPALGIMLSQIISLTSSFTPVISVKKCSQLKQTSTCTGQGNISQPGINKTSFTVLSYSQILSKSSPRLRLRDDFVFPWHKNKKNKQGIAETAKTNGPTCDNMCIQKI